MHGIFCVLDFTLVLAFAALPPSQELQTSIELFGRGHNRDKSRGLYHVLMLIVLEAEVVFFSFFTTNVVVCAV